MEFPKQKKLNTIANLIKKIPVSVYLFVPALLVLLFYNQVANMRQVIDEYSVDFLSRAYWGFALLLIAGFLLTAYMLYIRNIQIHTAFLIVGSVVGFTYLFLTFNSTPDAPAHFQTSYAYSNIILGHPMHSIRSADAHAMGFFYGISLSDYINLNATLFNGADNYEIISHRLIIHGLNNWWYYVSALGITVARLLGGSTTMLFFSAGLFNLGLFITGTYFAIKIMPTAKMLIFCVALFPTTMNQATSYSPDNTINVLSFLLIAMIFYLVKKVSDDEEIKIKEAVLLCIIVPLTLATKGGVYFPLIGLLLLIFLARRKGEKLPKTHLYMFIGVAVTLTAVYLWKTLGAILWDIGGDQYLPHVGVNTRSLAQIIRNPIETAYISINTLVMDGENHLMEAIGSGTGWPWREFPVRHTSILFAFIFIAVLSVIDIEMKKKQRIIIAVVTILSLLLIYLSMLLIFTPNYFIHIVGVQGRYLTPLLPLLFLLLAGVPWLHVKRDISKGLIIALYSVSILSMLTNFNSFIEIYART